MEEEDFMIVEQSKRRKHRFWMAQYLRQRTNPYQRNTLHKLELDFLRMGNVEEFQVTLRMPPDLYAELVNLVRPLIQRRDTNYRSCITVEERVSLTMRYLALGDSVRTLHQAYLVGYSSVLPIVRDTCQAIYQVLHSDHVKVRKI